jgi:hypothetical protein
MFNDVQKEFDQSVRKMAESSLLKKLGDQGLNKSDLTNEKFHELLSNEIEIMKSDGKKVGTGIGVGVALTLLTGGLF